MKHIFAENSVDLRQKEFSDNLGRFQKARHFWKWVGQTAGMLLICLHTWSISLRRHFQSFETKRQSETMCLRLSTHSNRCFFQWHYLRCSCSLKCQFVPQRRLHEDCRNVILFLSVYPPFISSLKEIRGFSLQKKNNQNTSTYLLWVIWNSSRLIRSVFLWHILKQDE